MKRKKTSTSRVFYKTGKRGTRGVERRQFHLLLTDSEYTKLALLSHRRKMNAADVLRTLIVEAA